MPVTSNDNHNYDPTTHTQFYTLEVQIDHSAIGGPTLPPNPTIPPGLPPQPNPIPGFPPGAGPTVTRGGNVLTLCPATRVKVGEWYGVYKLVIADSFVGYIQGYIASKVPHFLPQDAVSYTLRFGLYGVTSASFTPTSPNSSTNQHPTESPPPPEEGPGSGEPTPEEPAPQLPIIENSNQTFRPTLTIVGNYLNIVPENSPILDEALAIIKQLAQINGSITADTANGRNAYILGTLETPIGASDVQMNAYYEILYLAAWLDCFSVYLVTDHCHFTFQSGSDSSNNLWDVDEVFTAVSDTNLVGGNYYVRSGGLYSSGMLINNDQGYVLRGGITSATFTLIAKCVSTADYGTAMTVNVRWGNLDYTTNSSDTQTISTLAFTTFTFTITLDTPTVDHESIGVWGITTSGGSLIFQDFTWVSHY